MESSNTSAEISINFKDYISYSLKRWKKILLFAIIISIMVSFFTIYKCILKYNNMLDIYQSQIEQYNIDYDNYLNTKTGFELELVNMKERLDAQSSYNDNSLLIKLDPSNVLETRTDILLAYDSENESLTTDKAFINLQK